MDIVKVGSELLRQKSAPVKNMAKIAKLTEEMFDILRTTKGVGLAGPQIGVLERVFVVKFEGDVERVFINPSLLETSEETTNGEEGCLSIPGVWASLRRPLRVRVQAWNERGRPFTLEAEGVLARAILHEYDHLEGVLFIDRLSDLKRERIMAKYRKREKKQ